MKSLQRPDQTNEMRPDHVLEHAAIYSYVRLVVIYAVTGPYSCRVLKLNKDKYENMKGLVTIVVVM